MSRRSRLPAIVGALVLSLATTAAPSVTAQEVGVAFVTVDAAPEGAELAAGEHFEGTEMDNTRPLAAGAVGSLPVFVADDGYGCTWATAMASEAEEWIGVARRGVTDPEPDRLERCPGFQTKVTTAAAAGASALIVVNHSPGHEAGLAAGQIPSLMIDRDQGERLIAALDADTPDAVRVTLQLLDPNTFLPPAPVEPTRVQQLQAAADQGTLTVTGRALFGGQAPVTIGTDPAGDIPLPAELGYDLTEALIGQPEPFTDDLEFTFVLADLPASGGLPELARYIWDFSVNVPGQAQKLLSVEGKLSDVVRRQSTNVPAFFLRGNCVTADNITTCDDVAELNAVMDGAANRISVTVPRTVIEEQAGVPLTDVTIGQASICEGISTKVSAYFSACGGAAGGVTGDTLIPDDDPYYTPAARSVRVGIVPAGSPPAFTEDGSLGAGGNFSGTLDVSDLAPGDYDVSARACFGTNCATSTVTITI